MLSSGPKSAGLPIIRKMTLVQCFTFLYCTVCCHMNNADKIYAFWGKWPPWSEQRRELLTFRKRRDGITFSPRFLFLADGHLTACEGAKVKKMCLCVKLKPLIIMNLVLFQKIQLFDTIHAWKNRPVGLWNVPREIVCVKLINIVYYFKICSC